MYEDVPPPHNTAPQLIFQPPPCLCLVLPTTRLPDYPLTALISPFADYYLARGYKHPPCFPFPCQDCSVLFSREAPLTLVQQMNAEHTSVTHNIKTTDQLTSLTYSVGRPRILRATTPQKLLRTVTKCVKSPPGLRMSRSKPD